MKKFLPFWIFLVFFKFGAGLHYSLISPLGEKVLPIWIVGLIMGGGSIIQLILDVPAGHLLDKYGYKRLLKITTVIFLAATLCYVVGLTRITFIVSAIIATFGWLFFGPGINAYVLSHAPKEHSGKFISLRDVFGSIGTVLASAVLPFILLFNPHNIGYILFALLGVSLIALFFAPNDTTLVHQEIKIPTQHYYIKRESLINIVREIKSLNPASTMLMLLNMSGAIFYGAIWFVVPLIIAHQADAKLLGIGLGIFDFAIVTLGFILGNLADTANKRTLVFFGLLTFSISGLFIGFNFNLLFLLFGFLATTGDEMAGLSLWSWLHALDKNHAHDGRISGVINLSQDLGWAIGPIVAGFLYYTVTPSITILLCSIPIFLTWLVYVYTTHSIIPLSADLKNISKMPHRTRHRH
ncbi:MAG: MFS transporter [Candidatus Pacebacteria bacterium]|nr:MFS transporter [Candidatus Paceibacterota bacterium]